MLHPEILHVLKHFLKLRCSNGRLGREFLEPRVFQALVSRIALGWFVGQHPLDERFRLCTDVFPLFTIESESAFGDLFHNFLVCLARKRRIPAEKDVEDDSTGPDITFFIVFSLEYFRCNVIGRAKSLAEFLIGVELPGGTEIDDFQGGRFFLGLIDEIFWFEVSMNDFLLVAVKNGGKHLLHDLCSLDFGEGSFLLDLIK